MSWNLPRVINNLEAEIESGYVHDPATRDFSMAGYDVRNANLVKCNDVETNTVFSVNDELEKLNNFEATTTNPEVTTIVGKLNIENIDTNTIYDLTELTRIELNDNEVNIVTQNLTFNGQDVLTTANLETLENKTFYIDGSSISPNGTIFSNSIYADKYIINSGPSPAGYLMSDGTILNNSGDGVNSNIYLYNNNTTTTPIPANGQIRFNQPINADSTQLYVSHRTRDGTDIEDPFLSSISTLSIIYIQDQDINGNYIRFNVNSAPVIFPTSYVQLNVTFLDGGGNGLTNFGAGMNIFMSVFSNDIEIDTRLSNLETKCQNIEATSSKLTVNRSLELKLDEPDFFAIRSIDGFINYLIFDDTIMNLYTNLDLNSNDLSNVGSIKISSFENSNFFIKTDGTIDENDYIQATDTVITDLQAITQNISGFTEETQYNKNSTFILRDGMGDVVSIRDDQPSSNLQLVVSQLSAGLFVPLFMQQQRIRDVGAPLSGTDATTRDYVDTAILPLTTKTQNITATASENVFNKNSSFVLRVANSDSFTIKNDDSPFSTAKFIVSNTSVQIASVPLIMNNQKITLLAEPSLSTDASTKNYVDTNFIKMVSNTFTASWGTTGPPNNLITRTFTYKYIIDSTGSKIVTLGIPHIRTTITGGPLPLFSSSTPTALPAIIRPATESISAIRIVVNNVFEFGYISLSASGLISFARISSSWANNNNGNGSGAGVLGDYMYITYVAA